MATVLRVFLSHNLLNHSKELKTRIILNQGCHTEIYGKNIPNQAMSPKVFSVNDLINDLGRDLEKVSALTAIMYQLECN